jgi:hypothetical protein
MRDTASWIAIGAALISACGWTMRSRRSDLRDKVEKLIPQISGQSSWAIAAAVSVVAQAMEKLPN